MKLVIGITGEANAGKDVGYDRLEQKIKEAGRSMVRVRSSDILIETLGMFERGRIQGFDDWQSFADIAELWDLPQNNSTVMRLYLGVIEGHFDKGPINVHDRTNMQQLAQLMTRNENFGHDALTRAVEKRIRSKECDVAAYVGVRWNCDEDMIRSFGQNGILVYFTADLEVRLARARKYPRRGEEQLTREQLIEMWNAPNEREIPNIGSRADFTIANNGDSLEGLHRAVDALADTIISKYLT